MGGRFHLASKSGNHPASLPAAPTPVTGYNEIDDAFLLESTLHQIDPVYSLVLVAIVGALVFLGFR